ncbi:hypothetical protein DFO70_111184 [Cytobacillus firmus]|uniref:Uncharacterized protein n=2 Tax=Cytobacillus TaxID=2675230 RepID=A0A366JNP9_CYTFI|nr:hypothetical protein DFO70_111184 [Cytobacillus firmus]TDX47242.1 hypothetical protein DFO72_101333 [Cytobacillus oceanisediminis]
MGAVRNHEKKQLASFYFIACLKYRMGTGLLVFYSLEPSCINKGAIIRFLFENSNIQHEYIYCYSKFTNIKKWEK